MTTELTLPRKRPGASRIASYFADDCHTSLSSSATGANLDLARVADWVLATAHKLEKLGKLQQGWDSYGGHPLKPTARRLVIQVIRSIDQEDLPTPAVVLGSGGTVQLEWRGRHGKELDLDLADKDAIEFVTCDAEGNIEEGITEAAATAKLNHLACWLLDK